jgi:hypothetical protein
VACLKALRTVDSNEKSAMPFFYAEMDNAKEGVKANFNKVKKMYIRVT